MKSKNKHISLSYQPQIDGLRAIAVTSVILYHSKINFFDFTFMSGGFLGVDIFFVISGYLITSLILIELKIYKKFSFSNFYKRRIQRILPVLIFVILCSLPFAWFFLLPGDLIDFANSIIYSLGFSSNYYFYYSGLEYGATEGLKKPFLHLWSLSIEEQFYIFLPLLIVLINKNLNKYLLHTICILAAISFYIAYINSTNNPAKAFYFLHTRAWELLVGSILAYLKVELKYVNKKVILNNFFTILGFLIIIFSFFYFSDNFVIFILPTIVGTCMLIWFTSENTYIYKVLSSKLMVGIGKISYSLYLWHFPIFAFSRQIFFTQGLVLNKIYLLLCLISLSVFSYFFIEQKYRNKKINFSIFKYYLIIIIFFLILINSIFILRDGFKSRFNALLDYDLYKKEHADFKKNYNYNNFSNKKNVFIVGNSYADDLLNIFFYSNEAQKNYYFYTAVSDQKRSNLHNYQLICFYEFLKFKIQLCENNSFPSLDFQYSQSNYIIIIQEGNKFYLSDEFTYILSRLQKDGKKIIVVLDDVRAGRILDNYIIQYKRIPKFEDLKNIEKLIFMKSLSFEKEIINEVKLKLDFLNIKYKSKREILCDNKFQTCPILDLKNNRIFSDFGHVSEKGSIFFSDYINELTKDLN